MEKAWNKIKQSWEENPMAVIFVGSLAVSAATKLLHEVTQAKYARAWDREVERRRMMR